MSALILWGIGASITTVVFLLLFLGDAASCDQMKIERDEWKVKALEAERAQRVTQDLANKLEALLNRIGNELIVLGKEAGGDDDG